MKIEFRDPIVEPQPPKDVVITMSQDEADAVLDWLNDFSILDNVSGRHAIYKFYEKLQELLEG